MTTNDSRLLDSAQLAASKKIDSFEASMEPFAAVEASLNSSVAVEASMEPFAVVALEACLMASLVAA